MFDVGWSEILVIAVVAIVVVGPKELPRMLRTFGKTMGTVRRTANDFKRQFDEALREAERQADLGEAKSTIQSIGKFDPIGDIRKNFQPAPAAAPAVASATAGAPTIAAAPAPSPEPEKAAAETHEAEPLKTGAAAEPRVGNGAA
jgi:sec-independent protein translocase protein TatB